MKSIHIHHTEWRWVGPRWRDLKSLAQAECGDSRWKRGVNAVWEEWYWATAIRESHFWGPPDIKENNSGLSLVPLFDYGRSDLSLPQPQCVSPISFALWMQLMCWQRMGGGTAYLMLCLNLQMIHSLHTFLMTVPYSTDRISSTPKVK